MLLKARAKKVIPYVLDRVALAGATGSGCSFSLRKMRKNYRGPCINIRRSNDNATTDIGFSSNGDLDVGAISKFVGANSAFVATWYDQSGFGRHATQATTGSQPRIMNSGVLDTMNSRPAMLFIHANAQFLSNFDVRFLSGSQYTINAVEARNSAGSTLFFMGNINESINNTGLHFGYNDSTTMLNGQVGNDLTATVSAFSSTTTAIKTAILSSSNRIIYNNGTAIGSPLGSSTPLTLTVANQGMIGCGYNNNPVFCFDGYLQEVHFFARDLGNMRNVLEASQRVYFRV